jgi:hypothetical protein
MSNPLCKICGKKTLRWAWYEEPLEPIKYWYCLSCDMEGNHPFIQIHPNDTISLTIRIRGLERNVSIKLPEVLYHTSGRLSFESGLNGCLEDLKQRLADVLHEG